MLSCEKLLFPVHKPQHWNLINSSFAFCTKIFLMHFLHLHQLVCPQAHHIQCIDYLNFINKEDFDDAVNWIW